MEATVGRLLVVDFWIRKRSRCLLWWILAVVRVKAEARVGWRANVSESSWEDFGEIWWSVVQEFWMEVELGCCGGFRWMRGDSGLNWSWNGGGWIAGSWLRF